jgi:aryl-alcohol dehydrogenase-like predicted oxidoreductase
MRLALGTAQFGSQYGVANDSGQVTSDEVSRILHEAGDAGIDMLDTAMTYGNCEEILGLMGVQDWRVISKIPALPSSVDKIEEWLMGQVNGSRQRLGLKQFDSLLLHAPLDIVGVRGAEYVRSLNRLKEEGLTRSVGYSIYSPSDLNVLLPVFTPDLVQVPFNIIDRRLLNSGWMGRLVDYGIRIHTRSTFLQGLLVMSTESMPPWFNRWQSIWGGWFEACSQLRVSPLELALGFVLAQPFIERVVVGVDSHTHMKQILDAARYTGPDVYPEIESEDLELIEPYRWEL